MATMTADQMTTFLERTRQAILLTTDAEGRPNGVPVWFDWDGHAVQIFSSANAPKIRRIEHDPRVSVLVTNEVDEAPAWVSFEGDATIDPDADAKALAVDVLAPRYWDLNIPGYRDTVDQWAAAPNEAFVVIRLEPQRIRSSG